MVMDGAGRTAPDTPRKPEIATQLCAFTLFQGLSIHDLEQVAEVIESLTVEAGAFVVRQGEDSEDLFLIVAGTSGIPSAGRALWLTCWRVISSARSDF